MNFYRIIKKMCERNLLVTTPTGAQEFKSPYPVGDNTNRGEKSMNKLQIIADDRAGLVTDKQRSTHKKMTIDALVGVVTKKHRTTQFDGLHLFGTLTLFLLFQMLSFGSAHAQLQSSDYHEIRSKLQNSYFQFQTNKKGRVAFLGGSITYNPGWRDSTCAYLQRKFPNTEFEFIAAGIPSMGSTPGAFRLYRDVLSKGKVDLLFEEAAVNDPTNGRNSTTEQIRGMEGIIRHAKVTNPNIDIVTMYFVDPDKMEIYNQGNVPEVIQNHDRVAEHYGVSSINLAKEVTDRINAGEFTWKDDFKDLHPSPFGQLIYYNSIKALLEAVWQNQPEKTIKYPLPTKLDEFSYDHGELIDIKKASIIHASLAVGQAWKIDPLWQPAKGESTRAGYVNVPMLISENPGAELSFSFSGKAVGIAVAAGPDAGMIEYSIDGGPYRKLDLYTKWSKSLHLPWYYVLDAELNNEKHQLSMRISADRNPDSKGHACRIKTFFVNTY